MPIEISEMRPDDYPHVEALLQPTGGGDQAAQDGTSMLLALLNSGSLLSLVARHENEIVAAIICDLEGKCGYVHQKDLSDQELQDLITRTLVDKVTRKLQSRGIGRCRINLPHSSKEHPLWESAKWNDYFDADGGQPVRSTGAVDQMAAQYGGMEVVDPQANGETQPKPEFEDQPIPVVADEAALTGDSSASAADRDADPVAVVTDSGTSSSVASESEEDGVDAETAGAVKEASATPVAVAAASSDEDDEPATPPQDAAAA